MDETHEPGPADRPLTPIAAARRGKGFTQKRLAELLGKDQSFISRLESGDTEPSLELAIRICDVLGIQPRQLLKPEPAPTGTDG